MCEREHYSTCWTMKTSRQRPPEVTLRQLLEIANPVFDYMTRADADGEFGLTGRAFVGAADLHDRLKLRGSGHE